MLQSSGVAKRWTQPSNWTELIELELPNSHYLLSIRSSPLLPYNNFHTISVLLILLSIFLCPTSPTKMSPPLFKEIGHVSCHCWKALFPILHIAEKGARYILLTQPRFLANAISKEGASLVTQMVKHLPAMQETWVQSLGREDPLEKEMATHYSTIAWKIPWTEEPGRLQFMGLQRTGHDWATSLTHSLI